MRILKWLGIGVLVLAAVLVIGGYLLPGSFHVTRSVLIAAKPEAIDPLVADPRGWKQWSVWNQRDPGMQITYSGPPSGAGAKWAWTSKSEGDGAMTFTAAEPPGHVAFDLYFPDFGITSKGDIRLEPKGAATQVAWTMDGDMGANPLFHWVALAADSMVGKDFEAGLAQLKAVAERH